MEPLTAPQEAMWLADLRSQLRGQSVLEQFVIVEGFWGRTIDAFALEARAAQLVEARADLRCAFVVREGAMVREVRPAYRPAVRTRVLSAAADEHQIQCEVRSLIGELIAQVDLAQGSLLALGRICVAERTGVFVAVHHLVSDDIDMQRIKHVLAGGGNGDWGTACALSSPERPKPRERDLDYWTERQRHLVPMRSSPSGDGPGFAVETYDLSQDFTAALHCVTDIGRYTPFMVTLTAMQRTLGNHFATDSPVCLSMRSTRRRGTRNAPGMWVEPVLYALGTAKDASVNHQLDASRGQVLQALQTQLSFVELARRIEPVLDLLTDDEHTTVMFQHMGVRPALKSAQGETYEQDLDNSGITASPADLAWWVIPTGSGHKVRSVRNCRVVPARRVKLLVAEFEQQVLDIGAM